MSSTDRLEQIAHDLYGVLPAEFVTARTRATRDLRAAGERDLARDVAALRRPAPAAWLVNLVAREPGALDPLIELGSALRAAQAALDTATMKSLAARRPRIVGDLTERAVALAATADPGATITAAVRAQVTASLTAAIADPAAQAAVASGRLVSALSYAGFGEVDLSGALATPLRLVPAEPDLPAAEPPAERTHPSRRPAPDRQQLRIAQQTLVQAQQALEVAEASLEQARARRAAARRARDRAAGAVRELEQEQEHEDEPLVSAPGADRTDDD